MGQNEQDDLAGMIDAIGGGEEPAVERSSIALDGGAASGDGTSLRIFDREGLDGYTLFPYIPHRTRGVFITVLGL